LLLLILLFNWFGYRLLISFIEVKADAHLEEQLNENNYDESQLVSIKVPVTYLPYYNNSISFERIDGQIEIGGILYKYVKRRIYNDSLEMLCMPNHAAMKLQSEQNEFFKFVNDLQQEKKTLPHSGSAKNFLIDCYIGNDFLHLHEMYFTVSPISSHYSAVIPSRHTLTAEHPPQYCYYFTSLLKT
jgi:hypothetical protein